MALSPEILNALAKEHTRLSADHLRITQELNEIAALLRRNGQQIAPVAAPPLVTAPAPVADLNGRSSQDPPNLRQWMLKIMDDADRGYRPSELTNALAIRGFVDTGGAATPLGARVASEMARLFRDGRLGKDADGRYRSTVHNRKPTEPSALDNLMHR